MENTIEIETTGFEEILDLEIENTGTGEISPYEKMRISQNALDNRAFMSLINSTDREIVLVISDKEYTISSRGRNGYNPKASLEAVKKSKHPLEQTGLEILITPLEASKTRGRCIHICPSAYTLEGVKWKKHKYFRSWEISDSNDFRLYDRNADILNEVESIIVEQVLSLHPELDNSWYYGCQGGHIIKVFRYPEELWNGDLIWQREPK